MFIINEDFTAYSSSTINEKLWHFQTGGHGWGNKELQYYTTSSKNCFIDKEGLHLVCLKEDYDKNHYTSAKLCSNLSFIPDLL